MPAVIFAWWTATIRSSPKRAFCLSGGVEVDLGDVEADAAHVFRDFHAELAAVAGLQVVGFVRNGTAREQEVGDDTGEDEIEG